MKTIRILSVDGGGIRGLMPAILLADLERRAGLRIHEMFDFAAGTSTGAIIVGALFKSRPLTAQQVVNFYIGEGPRIFDLDLLRHLTSAVTGPKYPSGPLDDALLRVFGDAWLSDSLKPVLFPSYELTSDDAHFFKSWKAQGRDIAPHHFPGMFDYRFRDAVRASGAAPTYLAPARIRSRGGQEGVFIDGAVVANNPAMCAVASVRRIYPDADRIILVSLGTGQKNSPVSYDEAKSWGLLNWARPALDYTMKGAADAVAYQICEVFGAEMTAHRFDFTGWGDASASEIDDASSSNLQRLTVTAQAEIQRHAMTLHALPRLLTGSSHA
jgi:patatin-like phospholipase/acyl hydrolase